MHRERGNMSVYNIGKFMKIRRTEMGITQLQLAELADIDRSHISAIELGNVGVSFDLIFKLCEILDVKPRDLFDFRD